jgi:transposase
MSKIILGVDISKKHFDVSLFMDNKHKNKKFSNDKSGFKSLEYWIEKYNIEKIHVCLESTGFYGESLAEFLHKDGYKVSIVNPSCIKSYARSKLCRHKTDKIDAQLIAEYCDKYTPDFWQPLPEESKEVRELVRCIDALKLQHNQITNQLERKSSQSEAVSKVWEELKLKIEEKIQALYKEIDVVLGKNDILNKSYINLQTIPGIGKTTAMTLLAEIPDINTFKNARQLAAYAGLTPSQRFSGSSIKGKPRLSKIGSRRLRKALFFPSLVAKKHNSVIKNFCKNLEKKGKHAFAIVGAAMRKLLHIVFGVLKNKEAFCVN